MRKLLMLIAVALVGFTSANAQSLSGCNEAVIDASVQANEAQGYVLVSKEFVPILYLVPPTPPFEAGFYELVYTPDCEPLEPCPRILKIERFTVTVVNENGNCVIKKDNFR